MSAPAQDPFVVLPVRGIASGKSRLARVLDTSSREAFNEWLLVHTLTALHAWRGSLEACVVVSACERAAKIARARGAGVIRESEPGGLNAAAALGVSHACERGACSVLVLACDLPRLDAHALAALALDARRGDVVIAPDESGKGTNALVVRCGVRFEFCFGADSFARHSSEAAAHAQRAIVHRSPALAFDVDTPDDYARWSAAGAADPMV